jgi:hypothetical protein
MALQSALDAASELSGAAQVAALHALIADRALAGRQPAGRAAPRPPTPSPPPPPPLPPAAAADEDAIRVKELAIAALTAAHVAARDVPALAGLVVSLRPFFAHIPKARTAKVVRNVLDALGAVPDSVDAQVALCNETVEWCRAEKRSFLRLRVQLKLASLCVGGGRAHAPRRRPAPHRIAARAC